MECKTCGRRLTYDGSRCNYCESDIGKNKKNFTSSFNTDREKLDDVMPREAFREEEPVRSKMRSSSSKKEERTEREEQREIHERKLITPDEWEAETREKKKRKLPEIKDRHEDTAWETLNKRMEPEPKNEEKTRREVLDEQEETDEPQKEKSGCSFWFILIMAALILDWLTN